MPTAGFHFIYDDPTQHKAGQSPNAPGVFHSYGSTTADGLLALRICRAKKSQDPDELVTEDLDRQRAAFAWFSRNFRADTHPGGYA